MSTRVFSIHFTESSTPNRGRNRAKPPYSPGAEAANGSRCPCPPRKSPSSPKQRSREKILQRRLHPSVIANLGGSKPQICKLYRYLSLYIYYINVSILSMCSVLVPSPRMVWSQNQRFGMIHQGKHAMYGPTPTTTGGGGGKQGPATYQL